MQRAASAYIRSATRVIGSPRMMSDEAKKCRNDFVLNRLTSARRHALPDG